MVAVLLCLVCSIIVAGSAVALKPIQVKNKLEDKKKNILAAAGLLVPGKTIDEQFKQVTTRIVNLETGSYASDEELSKLASAGFPVEKFDQKKLAKNPKFSEKLKGSEDIASIKRQEDFAAVYLVEKDGAIDRIILPVHGYGLWSTLYGFVALEGDAETIAGLGFYSHAETPGLGGEVDNPLWKSQWPGKKVYADGAMEPLLGLIKGKVNPDAANAAHQIDGLSGATLTSDGVSRMVKFWMGENGYAPFLTNLKAGGV
jgi:Na+-transporting NADH:ubiquinone oxidoreductase subunit C